jgi:dihydropteroate synthase
MHAFQCGDFRFGLDRTLVMGVVNLTPDSFSDGGAHDTPAVAIAHAELLSAQGADIVDLGAESTRPGAPALPLEEEWSRLLPVLRALAKRGLAVSVDTYKPEVMRRALAEGAAMINDIQGFRLPGAVAAVAGSACGLCVMHMQRDSASMQLAPAYEDVVAEVHQFLSERVAVLELAGIERARMVLDPGFGFGKTVRQNYQLMHDLDRLRAAGLPLLVGVSRKSMIGAITGRPVGERLAGSVAAALAAVAHGASIVRVHDVAATVDALKVWRAIASPEQAGA